MTKEEYAFELDIYKKEQEALYYDTLNRFNAGAPLSISGSRFIHYNTHYIDLDIEGNSESIDRTLTEVRAKKEELAREFKNKNIKDSYEIVSGYEEDEIEETHFMVTWQVMKGVAAFDFSRGENILRRALAEVTNRPIYAIPQTLVREFTSGEKSWEDIVAMYNR